MTKQKKNYLLRIRLSKEELEIVSSRAGKYKMRPTQFARFVLLNADIEITVKDL